MALNVNVGEYLLEMHKPPFIEDYLSLSDTLWTVSRRPIIGQASEHEENVSQWEEMPELSNTFQFKNM